MSRWDCGFWKIGGSWINFEKRYSMKYLWSYLPQIDPKNWKNYVWINELVYRFHAIVEILFANEFPVIRLD